MTQRSKTLQGLLVLGLIVGIVGGNFVLHRWMLGDATSREVDAGTVTTNPPPEDLEEYRPAGRSTTKTTDPAVLREQLRLLIAFKFPQATIEEREGWLEELNGVPFPVAEGILDLRSELEKMKAKDDQRSGVQEDDREAFPLDLKR